ncbi:MAG: TraR/DksA C4-type zinc finger protein [Syntrophomonadaceae bacterium]|nr:TraR/DksA C4-type zinc finger protein [Syntrophomonadaceae bacterium]
MYYYDKLQAKKQEIERLIQEKQGDLMSPLVESTGELSLYDQHPADIASEVYEREKDYGMLELLELELEKVNDALDKCAKGQYGMCEICGRNIEPARLERVVNTTLCSNCARGIKDKFTRPAEEDITSPGDMADMGETFQVGGYEFYEE